MKRRLYLHIGRPKTGSSAIQHFLWINRATLLDRGFLFPRSVMHHRASHKLALVFQSYLPAHRVVAGMTAASVFQGMYDEASDSGSRAIIASSENLFLVDPSLIREQIPADIDTKIICYVRRQDHVLASSLIQEIKTGAVDIDTDVESYVFNRERMAWLDYEAILARWDTAFGRENIVVRIYQEPDQGWSIFEDFAEAVGLDIAGLDTPAVRVNPSPARDVLDFIRMINSCNEISEPRKPALRVPLLRASEQLGQVGEFDSHQMIPPRMREQVLSRFEASNAKVSKRYLGRTDNALFKPGVQAVEGDGQSYRGMNLERFAYMAAGLIAGLQSQIDKLERDLGEMKNASQKSSG